MRQEQTELIIAELARFPIVRKSIFSVFISMLMMYNLENNILGVTNSTLHIKKEDQKVIVTQIAHGCHTLNRNDD